MKLWLPIVLLGLGLGLDAEAADDKRDDVDFSGEWQLNEELSDDPREKMQEMMSKRRSGRGGGGGSQRGGGGGGQRSGDGRGGGRQGGGSGTGGPGGGGLGEDGQRRGGPFGDPEAAKSLSIAYDAPRLTIIDAAERGRVLYTDGRKVNRDYGEGRLVEVKARWKKGVLEVERKGERGSQRERYRLSEDGQRLTLESRIEMGRMGKFEIERVYDRAEASAEINPR